MSLLRIVLLFVGILFAAPALLMCVAGVLGVAGILADVGPDENRRLGLQAFSVAGIFAVVSMVLIATSYFARKQTS